MRHQEAEDVLLWPTVQLSIKVNSDSVLPQNGRPIAFTSKSLSDCERRYAYIEREILAVVFGCEHFHNYVYGKHFTIESNNKPLEIMHLKNMATAPWEVFTETGS